MYRMPSPCHDQLLQSQWSCYLPQQQPKADYMAVACRFAERLSWSELSEQRCYRKFAIRIFQYENSPLNSLGYRIYVKTFWPENNTQIKHIHFSDWLLDCQGAAPASTQARWASPQHRQGADSKKCIHQVSFSTTAVLCSQQVSR